MRLTDETIERIAGIATRVIMINPTLREKTGRDFGIEIDGLNIILSLYDKLTSKYTYRKCYYGFEKVDGLYELLDEFTELIEKTEAELNESNEV